MAFRKTFQGDAPERLNKWLGQSGVCSRREAEALIAAGEVRVDGEVVSEPGFKIAPGQTVELGTAVASALADPFTAVLNKPMGFVSGQPEPGETPAVRLLTQANALTPKEPAPSRSAALPPLGRLDKDSRGLLLLSEDGPLAKALIGPASRLDKEYLVTVHGQISPRALALLRHGLELDGRALKPAQVQQLGRQDLRFVLREGRKRQIRRMCQLVGLHVVDLLRVRIGPLALGDLPEGRWRRLTPQERAALIKAG